MLSSEPKFNKNMCNFAMSTSASMHYKLASNALSTLRIIISLKCTRK